MVGNKDGELGENKVKEGFQKNWRKAIMWLEDTCIFSPSTDLEDHAKLQTDEA